MPRIAPNQQPPPERDSGRGNIEENIMAEIDITERQWTAVLPPADRKDWAGKGLVAGLTVESSCIFSAEDAVFIAAAPDLLKALVNLLKDCADARLAVGCDGEGVPFMSEYVDSTEQAYQAIAKATTP